MRPPRKQGRKAVRLPCKREEDSKGRRRCVMAIETEFTPNPHSLKFNVNRVLLDKGTLFFTDPAQAAACAGAVKKSVPLSSSTRLTLNFNECGFGVNSVSIAITHLLRPLLSSSRLQGSRTAFLPCLRGGLILFLPRLLARLHCGGRGGAGEH